jgi:hypothetical protein
MSDTIQVTKNKKTSNKTTSNKKKTVKNKNIVINNIFENKMMELYDTIRKFGKLQEEYKSRLMPLIHNPDELMIYEPDKKDEQLSMSSNSIAQINAIMSSIHSVLVNLLDNLEI